MADGVNTRSHPRVNVEALVKVTGADREYAFRTRDLSQGGLFLFTRLGGTYPFRVGTRLELELLDEETPVVCCAVVARVVQEGSAEAREYPTGFAVKIVELDDDNRARLGTLLARGATGD